MAGTVYEMASRGVLAAAADGCDARTGAGIAFCAVAGGLCRNVGAIARCCRASTATAATPAATAAPANGRHHRGARDSRTCPPTGTGSPSMAKFTRPAKFLRQEAAARAADRLADQSIAAEALAQLADLA